MKFVSEHGRSYATKAEFEFRSNIFKNKLAEMEAYNNSQNTSRVGVNQFSDRTAEEMKRMNGFKPSTEARIETMLSEDGLADSVDWRTKGAVTPVKNQGQCGSCWSFSTTGAVEGAMFLSTGTLQSYSEQQLVDCSRLNHGCNGGSMALAFMYTERNPLELESEYPYTAVGGKCQYTASKGVGKVKSYTNVPKNSPAQLQAAIAKAPVSVAIEADQISFQSYKSGVITTGCGTNLDHGVLAVGYGTDATAGDYFIVKNSWGASWGDQGYVLIGAGSSNVCGILSMASYPSE